MPPSVKLVALCISSYLNGPGDVAFPSEATLSHRTRLSKRTVIRSVKWLVEHKAMTVSHSFMGDSKWPVNQYKFLNSLHSLVTESHLGDRLAPTSDTVSPTSDSLSKGGDSLSKGG